jgi:hypothetical protein
MIVGKSAWPALHLGISSACCAREFWPPAVRRDRSSELLRVDGRHLWNPSNLGIVAMLVLAADTVASLSVQWGNTLLPMVTVWLFGAVIINALGRLHVTLTYVVSFIAFAAVRAAVTGHPFLAEAAPITGPMYQLYIFFMITDPKTVRTRQGRMLTVFVVAAVETGLRLMQFVLPTTHCSLSAR